MNTSVPAASSVPPLNQNNQCGLSTTATSSVPTAGPVVWPIRFAACNLESAPPMRCGGVFATISACDDIVPPLKNPTSENRQANTSGEGANGISDMKNPMPSIARRIMILRPK